MLALVHDIRLAPLDETVRLILADYLEENGREGVAERTCKWLRGGYVVLNSLDMEALDCVEDFMQLCLIAKSEPAKLSPCEYKALWDECVRCESCLTRAVREEAESLVSAVESFYAST